MCKEDIVDITENIRGIKMRQTLSEKDENIPPQVYRARPHSDGEVSHVDGVDALPKKKGPVCMLQVMGSRKMKVRVVLSVHSNNYDHYAVVSQDKVLCKDCGFINLRNCRVERLQSKNSDKGFQIIPKHYEGQTLVFTVNDLVELESWLNVLGCDENPHCDNVKQNPLKLSSSPPRRPLGQLSPRGSLTSKPLLPALAEGEEESNENEPEE